MVRPLHLKRRQVPRRLELPAHSHFPANTRTDTNITINHSNYNFIKEKKCYNFQTNTPLLFLFIYADLKDSNMCRSTIFRFRMTCCTVYFPVCMCLYTSFWVYIVIWPTGVGNLPLFFEQVLDFKNKLLLERQRGIYAMHVCSCNLNKLNFITQKTNKIVGTNCLKTTVIHNSWYCNIFVKQHKSYFF